MIIFTHIPRTGGKTIDNLLQNNFSNGMTLYHRQYINPLIVRKEYDFIAGHIPYGIHKYFPDCNDFKYITFMRDPIERWISVFNKFSYDKGPFLYDRVRRRMYKDKLHNLLELCIDSDIHCNIMTKQISGMEKIQDIDQSLKNRK